jgi:hypothetical protein
MRRNLTIENIIAGNHKIAAGQGFKQGRIGAADTVAVQVGIAAVKAKGVQLFLIVNVSLEHNARIPSSPADV